MKATLPAPHGFEFYFPDRDTLLLVEETGDTVVIRATRNTFSEQRKRRFIHELAAEGFIPDSYQWFQLAEPGSYAGVRWLIDRSWLEISEAMRAPARRFMRRLLAAAVLFWLGLMAALWQGWLAPGAFFVASKSVPPPYSPASPPPGVLSGPRGIPSPP